MGGIPGVKSVLILSFLDNTCKFWVGLSASGEDQWKVFLFLLCDTTWLVDLSPHLGSPVFVNIYQSLSQFLVMCLSLVHARSGIPSWMGLSTSGTCVYKLYPLPSHLFKLELGALLSTSIKEQAAVSVE